MKTIILLIALVLCNLSFGCVILPNGNYIPCETNTTKILIEKSIKEHLKQIGYYKALIENKKIIDNIEYNVKLAESRLNEAEVKYVESIKKYKTTLHNAASKSFIKQKVYSEIAKQNAYSEMITAKIEYENARRECGMIYAIAKGELSYLPVGKSPREIFKLTLKTINAGN